MMALEISLPWLGSPTLMDAILGKLIQTLSKNDILPLVNLANFVTKPCVVNFLFYFCIPPPYALFNSPPPPIITTRSFSKPSSSFYSYPILCSFGIPISSLFTPSLLNKYITLTGTFVDDWAPRLIIFL